MVPCCSLGHIARSPKENVYRQVLLLEAHARGGARCGATRRASPSRGVPPANLDQLLGVISLGGDALADSGALYDGS